MRMMRGGKGEGEHLEGGEEECAVGDGVQLVVGEVEVCEGGQANKHKGVEHLEHGGGGASCCGGFVCVCVRLS